MKIIYYFLTSLFYAAALHSQGVEFPSEPVQAPISGLGLLIAAGTALAYKKFKK